MVKIFFKTLAVIFFFLPITFYATRSSKKFDQDTVQNDERVHTPFFRNASKQVLLQSAPGKKKILIYNRVPKTGSGTIIGLLLELQKIHNFSLQIGNIRFHKMNDEDELNTVNLVRALPNPAVFINHFLYINFTKYNEAEPIYMNLVRDPVEKIISKFFFKKFKRTKGVEYNSKEVETTAEELIECARSSMSRCSYIHGSEESSCKLTIPFFCGNDWFCLIHGNRDALERAKYIVEKKYRVVGVLEDLHKSLKVFENQLPEFFTGVSNFDVESKKRHVIVRENAKQKLEALKHELMTNMTMEYELYEFIKQRLNRQYEHMSNANERPVTPFY